MSFRNLGVWLPGVRIEVEVVRKAHRLPCLFCEEVPEGRRLKVVEGNGRGASTYVLCVMCGSAWIEHLREEGLRAQTLLVTGILADDYGSAVRMDHDIRDKLRAVARDRAAKAKAKKQQQ